MRSTSSSSLILRIHTVGRLGLEDARFDVELVDSERQAQPERHDLQVLGLVLGLQIGHLGRDVVRRGDGAD